MAIRTRLRQRKTDTSGSFFITAGCSVERVVSVTVDGGPSSMTKTSGCGLSAYEAAQQSYILLICANIDVNSRCSHLANTNLHLDIAPCVRGASDSNRCNCPICLQRQLIGMLRLAPCTDCAGAAPVCRVPIQRRRQVSSPPESSKPRGCGPGHVLATATTRPDGCTVSLDPRPSADYYRQRRIEPRG